jgi:cell division protein FtsI (penicillin-binding protein 3)
MLAVMLFALGAVVGRLFVVQLSDSRTLAALGQEQRLKLSELPAVRGQIIDRNGTPLAMSLEAVDVYANPELVTHPVIEAHQIAQVLGMDPRSVRDALGLDGTFVYLDRQVDKEVADTLAALQLPGIGFLPVAKRYYPAGSVASQLLGFVNVDGEGITGLELAYDDLLAGTPGERLAEMAARGGVEIAGGSATVSEPIPGSNLVLTIDRQIQFAAQRALRDAILANRAKGGSVIVMHPTTGDIYAMASFPWFDPNRFAEYSSDRYANRAVTDTWEPGSVNKVITVAAALETGAVSPTERIRVPWVRTVGGFQIHDSHPHPVEFMTLGDIIAHSSNIGSSLVADRVGNSALADFFESFGYGRPTGVGFPGEAAGLMPEGDDWKDVTRATISFGAGVAVTPLQMASVYATVANGGVWVEPRLVVSTIDPAGQRLDLGPGASKTVLEPSTADLLTRMLAYVVEDGTGVNAQIAGYQVAGKTGTTKKLDSNGNYTDRYVASFVGFLPASEPEVVIAVVLDEPRTIYGGVAAAPVFQDVARFAIQRLGIEPAPTVKLPPHLLATS